MTSSGHGHIGCNVLVSTIDVSLAISKAYPKTQASAQSINHTLLLSIIFSLILKQFNDTLITTSDSIQLALSKITLIVFYLIVIFVSISTSISSFVSAILGCFSVNRVIKVLSIILLILVLCACLFCAYEIYIAYKIYF